ncbi:hypothetical protein HY380_01215 [Candidatus Saccharibacteria bacterium]|nr:hypothetical protein [Candidatus Saccharibacteria bacterium]
MAAKIKKPPGHDYNPFRHKPRGVHPRAFEKVYWPYLPLILLVSLVLGVVAQPGAVSRLIGGQSRVLSYAVEMSRDGLLSSANAQRATENLPDLRLNARLDKAAQVKANDMAKRDYWSHSAPGGKSPWTFVLMQNYDYRKLGENLAAGFGDSTAVTRAWLASPTHRQNLMDSAYSDVGFGVANIADYSAAGGGPMTLVVAYYGQPASSATQSSPVAPTTNPPASTLTVLDERRLGASTSRAQLSLASLPLAPYATAGVIVAGLAAVGFWAGRHFIGFRRAWLKSERFVIRHPAVDLFLISFAFLSLLLSQTAGLIQ